MDATEACFQGQNRGLVELVQVEAPSIGVTRSTPHDIPDVGLLAPCPCSAGHYSTSRKPRSPQGAHGSYSRCRMRDELSAHVSTCRLTDRGQDTEVLIDSPNWHCCYHITI